MPKVLICSDLHEQRRPDEQYALCQIIDIALGKKVDAVIGAGDLFNTQTNRAEAPTFFYRQLDRLHKRAIPFWYIEGQHDWDSPSWPSGHGNAFSLHKEILEVGSFTFYGLNFQPFGKLQEELAQVPSNVNAMVCHQVWADFMGDIAAPQGEFCQIPGHVHCLITGDLHQWKLKPYKNADGYAMLVCSPGAVAQQAINEPDEHYFAIMDCESGKIEQIKLKSRVLITSSVLTTSEDLDRFVANIESDLNAAEQKALSAEMPEEMVKPRLWVTYSSKLTDAVRRIERAVGERAFIRFKDKAPEERREAQRVSASQTTEAVTPLTVLADEVDKEEFPQTYQLCERLLRAQDPEMEFSKWRAEQLES